MIIWKGWGFLVVAITCALVLAVEGMSHLLAKNEKYLEGSSSLACALFAAGVINGALGVWLNKGKVKTFLNQYSRKEIVAMNYHTLFFIRMEYWGIILMVCSVLVFMLK